MGVIKNDPKMQQKRRQGQQQDQQSVNKTWIGKVPLQTGSEVDIRYVAPVLNVAGDGASTYVKNGAVYGVNYFALDQNKKAIREKFVMSKFLSNVLVDMVSTITIEGEEYFDLEQNDLVVKVFKEGEINWLSAGTTEAGLSLADAAEKLKKASGSNILDGATTT